MSAATDGHQQLLLAAEIHRAYNVGYVGAAHYQTWAPVDHPVVYVASSVVTRIAWLDQPAA
jgi:hypothetical protein